MPPRTLTAAACLLLVFGIPAACRAGGKVADPADFPYLGEYAGKWLPATDGRERAEADVFLVKGEVYCRLWIYPGADEKPGAEGAVCETVLLKGKAEGEALALEGSGWTATLRGDRLEGKGPGGGSLACKREVRTSPTLEAKPPEGAIVLLPYEPGKTPSLDAWTNTSWKTHEDGSMEVGKGDIRSKRHFGDYRLHVEFHVPLMPDSTGQGRGNSGIYNQDKYEVQVLDSFGLVSRDNDCGGVYKVAAPRVNACLPPGRWQTYDIVFRAPRFGADGKKTESARLTVRHNGILIHENLEVPHGTGSSRKKQEVPEAPLRLQDHGNPVRFRNIWLVPGTGGEPGGE